MPRCLLALALFLTSFPLLAQSAGLSVNFSDTASPAAPDLTGFIYTYPSLRPGHRSNVNFFVKNLGAAVATGVEATVAIPKPLVATPSPQCLQASETTFLCRASDVPPADGVGTTAAGLFDVFVPEGAPPDVTFVMDIRAATPESNPANNHVEQTEKIYDVATFALSISAPDRLPPERTADVRVSIENTSDLDAQDIHLSFVHSASSTVRSLEAPVWECSTASATEERCVASTIPAHSHRDLVAHMEFPAREMHVTIDAQLAQSVSAGFQDTLQTVRADVAFYRVFDVTTTADSGPGSLRQAILDANSACGNESQSMPCKIAFQIPEPVPAEGWYTVPVASTLPPVVAPDVAIDGEAQTGLTGDTNPNGPEVFVRAEPGVSGDGFMFYSRIVNVRGLAVGGFGGNGLLLFSRRATIANSTFLSQITGNYLGIDPSGARAAGNALRGIMTDDFNGEIARNVIGGNGRSGIFIGGVGSVSILDNRLGVAAAANDPIPNGASGIYLARRTGVFSHSTITGNVVANSGEWGIALGRDAAVNIDLGVNTLFANRLRGIDVGLDGPTLDRPAEVAPLITSARFDEASGDTIIAGTTPVGVYKTRTEIYLYANTRLDADGFAEGEEFLGVAFLPPGGVFELRVHRDLRGKWIDGTTHTINNLSDLLVYETSEFSRPVRVGD